MRRLPALLAIALLTLSGTGPPAYAEPTVEGMPLQAVLERFRARGIAVVYSSALVTPDLVVAEPPADFTLQTLQALLAEFGLRLESRASLHLVTRAAQTAQPAADTPAAPAAPPQSAPAGRAEEVVVAASRYRLGRETAAATVSLSGSELSELADLADDPVRAARRLPGATASDYSAKPQFRGGHPDETAIVLDDLRLVDPYHMRDFQSLFSALDARAIDAVEIYSGAFPARYGDSTSALLLVEPLQPEGPPVNELGLSVFNTSWLNHGTGADGNARWLFSIRRGNLDLVIDPKFGEPQYFDLFGHLSLDLTARTTVTINSLIARDNLHVISETDPEELEQSRSKARNQQFWVNLDQRWSPALSSSTQFAFSALRDRRRAAIDDPGKMIASLEDRRTANRSGFRQDWLYSRSDRSRWRFGLEAQSLEADFENAVAAEYFETFAAFGRPPPEARALSANISGTSVGAYLTHRRALGARAELEMGMRWDRHDYVRTGPKQQLAPRVNLLYRIAPQLEARLSWGRYHQAEPLYNLPVSDGDLNPAAQATDQAIAGLTWRPARWPAWTLRGELFDKRVREPWRRYENLFNPVNVLAELQPDRVLLVPTSAEIQGLELSARYRPDGPVSGWFNYTRSRARDRVAGADVPRSWDQPHTLQAGLRYSGAKVLATLAATYRSGWPTTGAALTMAPGEPGFRIEPGNRNALRLGSYVRIDARISRDYSLRAGTLTAFAELTNVTNRGNACCIDLDIDDAGAPVLLFDQEDFLPRLPAIGFLLAF